MFCESCFWLFNTVFFFFPQRCEAVTFKWSEQNVIWVRMLGKSAELYLQHLSVKSGRCTACGQFDVVAHLWKHLEKSVFCTDIMPEVTSVKHLC